MAHFEETVEVVIASNKRTLVDSIFFFISRHHLVLICTISLFVVHLEVYLSTLLPLGPAQTTLLLPCSVCVCGGLVEGFIIASTVSKHVLALVMYTLSQVPAGPESSV